MKIRINSLERDVPTEWADATLLTVLRDYFLLTGTKFGCGIGICGACTVHVDGQAVRSCVVSVRTVKNKQITTIEGLSEAAELHPVQRAWKVCSVPQCGYCQSGQIMTAAAFLERNDDPTVEEVVTAMNGNLCRCGTYARVQKGVLYAAKIRKEAS